MRLSWFFELESRDTCKSATRNQFECINQASPAFVLEDRNEEPVRVLIQFDLLVYQT